MRIEYAKIDKNTYDFYIDGDQIGVLYKTLDEFGKDNWTAVDNLDGLTFAGVTKQDAVEGLHMNKLLDEAEQALTQELFK